jgi:DNA-binding response OmpR family regulator
MKDLKILVVEDEHKVAEFIKQGLDELGAHTTLAFDGEEGKNLALTQVYDALVLDVNLPLINGYDLCKLLRQQNRKMPIIMLTAMGTTEDKLSGFDSGADDYVVKPFEFKELVARIRSITRRARQDNPPANILRVSDLEINLDNKIVKRAGKKIDLMPKEFHLLEYLVRNKGKVLSRAEIAEKIWDITFETGTNVIDVYVNFLRKKIDKEFTPKLIHTVIGMGYILKEGSD